MLDVSLGVYPSGQRGRAVNPLAFAFGGSNPPAPNLPAIRLDQLALVETCYNDQTRGLDSGGPISPGRSGRTAGSTPPAFDADEPNQRQRHDPDSTGAAAIDGQLLQDIGQIR